jgi:hypothetical protein
MPRENIFVEAAFIAGVALATTFTKNVATEVAPTKISYI